ncbi:alpha-L-rhamnosidase [Nocardia cerradoensis]|uniref:alpha-L-rhamnosidase n=1 Tax=Nocardia cerradoensis TaxID=85688 RepID=A0A231GU86_9NOCA|nr:alpha-L-rhamnosidase [Nocardia cerradoensis]NKY43731.1 family 78 glycoside hydrolase catalytic domain [Nocardia cerradoensis]OXR40105.1 hypothetical protein B7C42_07813 [Nocardia cerradoensis]
MALHLTDLRVNSLTEPIGVHTPRPEFSWKISTSEPGILQSACALQVCRDGGRFEGADLLWDSGRIPSDRPFGILYQGHRLQSRKRYLWRVKMWDNTDTASTWSEPATFETGILDPELWTAQWVTGPPPSPHAEDTPLYFRGQLDVTAEVVRARAYVSALGWYRLFVNSTDVTGNALVPRWTPLDEIVEYQTYDVTDLLRNGRNALGVVVADGRYRGRSGAFARRAIYGDQLAAFVQLHLELADGNTEIVTTDHTWRAGTGRILHSDPMYGESADLRISESEWLDPAAPLPGFTPVRTITSKRQLVGEAVARVQETRLLEPAAITRTPSGKQLVDFGQNFAGVTRIHLPGRAGLQLQLTHAELTTSDGELDTLSFVTSKKRPWYQRDKVVTGPSATWYQPWFTIHGFRYVEIDGLDEDLRPEDVRGVVLSTDLTSAGTFECSDSRLEQLHRNVEWSLRSNFVDTATDCPTRERSGWTGDLQIFAPTATMFADVQAYIRRYLANLAVEQLPSGGVPPYVPSEQSAHQMGKLNPFTRFAATRVLEALAGSAGWGDAAVLLPWTLFRYYGDTEILRQQWSSMTRWVDRGARVAATKSRTLRRLRKPAGSLEKYVLDTGFHWGEWIRPGETVLDKARDAMTHRPVVATAYLAYSSRILSEIAAILGYDTDARRYGELAEHVTAAYRAAFVRDGGRRIGRDRQDDYVRSIAFELLSSAERTRAMNRLAELVEAADYHLDTGFLSTPMLLPTLADNGRADLAFRLLLQTTSPAWLYQVERGATTIWESWEGYDADGNGLASHNHYAFGSVAAWLYEGLAGISPAEPGYRVIRIAPRIGGGLTRVAASIHTPFGRAASEWRIDEDRSVHLRVEIPPGTEALVTWDSAGTERRVGSGTHEICWQ